MPTSDSDIPMEPVARVKPAKLAAPLPVKSIAPAEDDGPPPGFEDMFALAGGMPAEAPPPLVIPAVPGAGCPSCGAAVGNGAVICVNCGHNLKTGKKLKTATLSTGNSPGAGGGGARPALAAAGGGAAGMLGYAGTRKRGGEEEVEKFFSIGKELYLPIALVILGTVLTYLEVVYVRKETSPARAIGMVGVLTLINFVLVTAGVLTAVRLFELGLGPIQTALLKIAAVSMLPGAVASLVEHAIFGSAAGFSMTGFVGFFISYVLTFSLFMWLLEMDYFESVMCAVIIWAIRTWVGFAILGLIFSGNGNGIGGGAGTVIGLGGGSGADEIVDIEVNGYTAAQTDKLARDSMKNEKNAEARFWIGQNETARLHKQTRTQTVRTVEDLYAMGAKEVRVTAIKEDGEAPNLIITLPEDLAKRKKLLAWQAAIDTRCGRETQREARQKYLLVYLTSDEGEDEK